MKSIEQRANETFPEKWRNVTIGGTMEHAFDDNEFYREGFIEGAKSEHEELTRWNSPECEPKVNTPILLKMEGPRKDIIYRTGYFIVDYVANDRTVYFYKVIGWREIHE